MDKHDRHHKRHHSYRAEDQKYKKYSYDTKSHSKQNYVQQKTFVMDQDITGILESIRQKLIGQSPSENSFLTYFFTDDIVKRFCEGGNAFKNFPINTYTSSMINDIKKFLGVDKENGLLLLCDTKKTESEEMRARVNKYKKKMYEMEETTKQIQLKYREEKKKVMSMIKRLQDQNNELEQELGEQRQSNRRGKTRSVEQEKWMQVYKRFEKDLEKAEFALKEKKVKFQILYTQKSMQVQNLLSIVADLKRQDRSSFRSINRPKPTKKKSKNIKYSDFFNKNPVINERQFRRGRNSSIDQAHTERSDFGRMTYNKKRAKSFIDPAALLDYSQNNNKHNVIDIVEVDDGELFGFNNKNKGDLKERLRNILLKSDLNKVNHNSFDDYNSSDIQQNFRMIEKQLNDDSIERPENILFNLNASGEQRQRQQKILKSEYLNMSKDNELRLTSTYKLAKAKEETQDQKVTLLEDEFKVRIRLVDRQRFQETYEQFNNKAMLENESEDDSDVDMLDLGEKARDLNRSFSESDLFIMKIEMKNAQKKISKLKERLNETKYLNKTLLEEKDESEERAGYEDELSKLKAVLNMTQINENTLFKDIKNLKHRLNRMDKELKTKRSENQQLKKKLQNNDKLIEKLNKENKLFTTKERFSQSFYEDISSNYINDLTLNWALNYKKPTLTYKIFNNIKKKLHDIKNMLLNSVETEKELEKNMIERKINDFRFGQLRDCTISQLINNVLETLERMIRVVYKEEKKELESVQSGVFNINPFENMTSDNLLSRYQSNQVTAKNQADLKIKIKKNKIANNSNNNNELEDQIGKLIKEKDGLNEQIKDLKRRLLKANSKVTSFENDIKDKFTEKEALIDILKGRVNKLEAKTSKFSYVDTSYATQKNKFQEIIKTVLQKYEAIEKQLNGVYDATNKLHNLKEKKMIEMMMCKNKFVDLRDKLLEYHSILQQFDEKLKLNFADTSVDKVMEKVEKIKAQSDFYEDMLTIYVGKEEKDKKKVLEEKLDLEDEILKIYKDNGFSYEKTMSDGILNSLKRDLGIVSIIKKQDTNIDKTDERVIRERYSNIFLLIEQVEKYSEKKLEEFDEKLLNSSIPKLYNKSNMDKFNFAVKQGGSARVQDPMSCLENYYGKTYKDKIEKLKKENHTNLMNYKNFFDKYTNLKNENINLRKTFNTQGLQEMQGGNSQLKIHLKNLEKKMAFIRKIFLCLGLNINEKNLKEKFLEKYDEAVKNNKKLKIDSVKSKSRNKTSLNPIAEEQGSDDEDDPSLEHLISMSVNQRSEFGAKKKHVDYNKKAKAFSEYNNPQQMGFSYITTFNDDNVTVKAKKAPKIDHTDIWENAFK